MPRGRYNAEARGQGWSWFGPTKDGRYRGWVEFPDTTGGKPKRVWRSGQTSGDIAAKIRELVAKREENLLPDGDKVTVRQWVTAYIADMESERDWAPSTWAAYESAARLHIIPAIGDVTLGDLKGRQISDLYQRMKRDGLSGSRINDVHNVISGSLEHAIFCERIGKNVARHLPNKPSQASPEAEHLHPAEVRRVLAVLEHHRNGIRWETSLSLGGRQAEWLALGWDQWDPEAQTLGVHRQLQRLKWRHGCLDGDGYTTCEQPAQKCPARHGGGLIMKEPKSDSARDIPVPDQVAEMIERHRRAQLAERMRTGRRDLYEVLWVPKMGKPKLIEVDLMFPGVRGVKPRDRQDDWAEWKQILVEANVRVVEKVDKAGQGTGVLTSELTVHNTRHTAATMLLELGVDTKVVAYILGHSTEQTTKKLYQHVRAELAAKAAQQLGDALYGPAKRSGS